MQLSKYLQDGDLTTRAVVARRMVSSDMPRIPTEPLEGVAFLYRTKEEAAANARIGGTAFLLSKYAPKISKKTGQRSYVPFWVSNRHVVFNASSPVVRVNRRDHGTTIFDYDCLDWIPHPAGDDLAATCAFGHIDTRRDEIRGVPDWYLLTEAEIERIQLGIGDEVVMLGRFVNHQGREKIRPAVRFGSISMMPEPIWNDAIKKDQLSYAVEMRSREGFSGSPVAMYRIPRTALIELPDEIQHVHGLLGVCWGHILNEEGENTWLNGVIPAWRVLDLFKAPKLREQFEAADSAEPNDISQNLGARPSVAEPPTKGENPQHREDFNQLLGAAARGSKPSPGKA